MQVTPKTKLTLEEWKASVRTSRYIREGEEVVFQEIESRGDYIISAIINPGWHSIHLGYYFISARIDPNLNGTGWHH